MPGTSLRNQLFILSTRHNALGRPRLYLFGFYAGNDLSDMVNDEPLSAPAAQVPRSSGLLVDPIDCMMNRDGLYYRGMHLSPAGHRAMAECIGEPLEDLIKAETR